MIKNVYISSSNSYRLPFDYLVNEVTNAGLKVINENNDPYIANHYLDYSYMINSCDLFLAFLDDFNPRIYFELGYASSLYKKIILICDYSKEIPHFLYNYTILRIDYLNINLDIELKNILNTINNDVDFKLTKLFEEEPINSIEKFFQEYEKNPLILETINTIDFENLIYEYFKSNSSYNTTKAIQGVDYGYDMALENYKGFNKTLVEVKKYSYNSKISINVLQQLVGAMSFYNADHGILITTSHFTRSAKDFAESSPYKIELWDFNTMHNMILKPDKK